MRELAPPKITCMAEPNIYVQGVGRTSCSDFSTASLIDLLTEAGEKALDRVKGRKGPHERVDAVIVAVQLDARRTGRERPLDDGVSTFIGSRVLSRLQQLPRFRNALEGAEVLRVETAGVGLASMILGCRLLRSKEAHNVLVIGGDVMRAGKRFVFDPAELDAILSEDARALRLSRQVVLSAIFELYLAHFDGSTADFDSFRRAVVRDGTEKAAVAPNPLKSHRGEFPFLEKAYDTVKQFFKKEGKHAGGRRINRWITSNLTSYDVAPACNGAGAVFLSTSRRLGRERIEPLAEVLGYGMGAEGSPITKRPTPYRFAATSRAMQKTCFSAQASLAWLRSQLAAGQLQVETQSHYSPLVAVNLVDLGLFANFEAVRKCVPAPWLNPSGGVWDGHPLDGGALIRVAEAVNRIANSQPVDSGTQSPRFVLNHSIGGAGKASGIVLLAKTDARPKKGGAVTPRVRVGPGAGSAMALPDTHARLLCIVRFERVLSDELPEESELISYAHEGEELWLNGYRPNELNRSGLENAKIGVIAAGLVVDNNGVWHWALAADAMSAGWNSQRVREERPKVHIVPLTGKTSEGRKAFRILEQPQDREEPEL